MTWHSSEKDLAGELLRLQTQVTSLQERNNKEVEERRFWKRRSHGLKIAHDALVDEIGKRTVKLEEDRAKFLETVIDKIQSYADDLPDTDREVCLAVIEELRES